ncbi:MAG: hypothetical protein HY261_09380, partial [Chloroflexi bacterium]|nr:hypothetical protein [Chloroflexota bacterium]
MRWHGLIGRRMRTFTGWYLARLTMYGFGQTALAISFTVLILPTRVIDLVPAESKNTYLGLLSLTGL